MTAEKKGIAVDRRRLWLDLENAEYIRETLGFPGCQIALRVDRDVIADDGPCGFPTRATSSPASIRRLTSPPTSCWQPSAIIGRSRTSVFFLKDRWWDEDRHWTRRPGLSQWLAQLTTAATIVLRIFRRTRIPLRAPADHIQWRPLLGLEMVGVL